MLLKVKKEIHVLNIFEFLNKFNLEQRFKKDYNLKNIEDWEFEVSDSIIIKKYLDDLQGNYFVIYNPENTGSFTIYEIEKQKIYEITDPKNGDEILFTGNEYLLIDLLNNWLNEDISMEKEKEEKENLEKQWRGTFKDSKKRQEYVKMQGLVLNEIFEV